MCRIERVTGHVLRVTHPIIHEEERLQVLRVNLQ
jgi:hypothetical protein